MTENYLGAGNEEFTTIEGFVYKVCPHGYLVQAPDRSASMVIDRNTFWIVASNLKEYFDEHFKWNVKVTAAPAVDLEKMLQQSKLQLDFHIHLHLYRYGRDAAVELRRLCTNET